MPGTAAPPHLGCISPTAISAPSTCAGLYAAAAPFWYVALRRMKRALHTRLVPLLSVFAAFSFIVMMFNLPLPGGTTGHATGVAVAAIVLGPCGVDTRDYNGAGHSGGFLRRRRNHGNRREFVQYGDYRLDSGVGCVPVVSGARRRRIAAPGVCGGVRRLPFDQPRGTGGGSGVRDSAMFFHDASGAPLYAPYPLRIAIPAMMIGHLTVAGLAELVISAGVVAYLQRADPALLLALRRAWSQRRSVPGSEVHQAPVDRARGADGSDAPGHSGGRFRMGRMDAGGLRQCGGAATDRCGFGSGCATRRWRPRVCGGLATVWTAPMPRYAPPFLRSASFGYLLSAITGAGLTIFVFLLAGWITGSFKRQRE